MNRVWEMLLKTNVVCNATSASISSLSDMRRHFLLVHRKSLPVYIQTSKLVARSNSLVSMEDFQFGVKLYAVLNSDDGAPRDCPRLPNACTEAQPDVVKLQ